MMSNIMCSDTVLCLPFFAQEICAYISINGNCIPYLNAMAILVVPIFTAAILCLFLCYLLTIQSDNKIFQIKVLHNLMIDTLHVMKMSA